MGKNIEGKCNCCECQGVYCNFDHPGHSHTLLHERKRGMETPEEKDIREQEEMWEEALRMNF